jgi:hypothetical protein
MLLDLEEDSVRKTPNTRTTATALNNGKSEWVFRDFLNRSLNSPRKALAKLRPYVIVPGAGLLQLGICFRQPDNRQCHDFLNSFALTCSQGITSEGFFSCRSMR